MSKNIIKKSKLTIKRMVQSKMKLANVGKAKLDTKRRLRNATIAGLQAVKQALPQALDDAMLSETWTGFNPKRPYRRKNGELMSSAPRDIVDTGKLFGTGKVFVKANAMKVGGGTIRIKYGTPYAKMVYYGGVIIPYGDQKNAPVTLPARPWIRATLEGTHGIQKFPLMSIFRTAFLASLKIGA